MTVRQPRVTGDFYTSLTGISLVGLYHNSARQVFVDSGVPIASADVLTSGMENSGKPPNWEFYLWSRRAEDGIERARSGGASFLQQPAAELAFAHLVDPFGAVFSLGSRPGLARVGLARATQAHIRPVLASRCTDESRDFYAHLMRCRPEDLNMMFVATDVTLTPTGWFPLLPYTLCTAAIEAREGVVLAGFERWAVGMDPEGALFGFLPA